MSNRNYRLTAIFVTAVLCYLLLTPTLVGAFRITQDTDDVTLALARRAARAFCERFDFPPAKIAEIDGAPILGPMALERDGKRVTAIRWLGNGRGNYCVHVEVYSVSGRVVVYGGYNHNEFGPWTYKKCPSRTKHALLHHAAELAIAAERAQRGLIGYPSVDRARPLNQRVSCFTNLTYESHLYLRYQ